MTKLTADEIRFIDETLLARGVDSIYPTKQALREALLSGRKLTMYVGIDPTASVIHIGNAIVLRKLAQFQKLGHTIIFLVGDFTARLGDPSDKEKTRRMLTEDEIKANVKSYKEQASTILKFDGENPALVKFNSEWLDKLTFGDVIKLASNFTLQQMIERDMFQERIKAKEPIGLHEFLYPLMQGYDSVAMQVDMELGGTDQTFNMLAGRTLMKNILNKEKFVLTTPLILGTDGRKMSKSFGNFIALTATPVDKFGKAMSIGDELIIPYFELTTDLPMDEVKEMEQQLKKGDINPMDLKKKLALEIVKMYDGEDAAEKAQAEFERVVQKGELPDAILEYTLSSSVLSTISTVELLEMTGLADSKSSAKRLIQQGGVEKDGKKIHDTSDETDTTKDVILRVGKRKAVKVIRSSSEIR